MLDVADIEHILTTILARSSRAPLEITLEANPGDLTPDKLTKLRQLGINRLSIGIQSFNDDLLRLIGRRHTAAEARQAVLWAQQAGFDNLSVDLMYGLPGQTLDDWSRQIEEVLRLQVQHISTYCLSYEPGTVLTAMLERGEITETDDDIANAMADLLAGRLTTNGYVHYEVSNFALPGRESKHNSSYWDGTPYIGLGAGAHSYDGNIRSWHKNDVQAYIREALAQSLHPEQEVLTDDNKRTERIMLALRTRRGISVDELPPDRLDEYVQKGLMRIEDNRAVVTREGLHILNRIIADMI